MNIWVKINLVLVLIDVVLYSYTGDGSLLFWILFSSANAILCWENKNNG